MAEGRPQIAVVAPLGGVTADATREEESIVDLGLAGLVLLAQYHGIAADAEQLKHQYGRGNEPFDESTLLLAAKQLGLKGI